jgi:sigma-E factor negative regulatory protein RseA
MNPKTNLQFAPSHAAEASTTQAPASHEALSAFMDGELATDDARHLLRNLRDDPRLLDDWHMHHLIGDALRGEHAPGASVAHAVRQRLQAEPTVLAPGRWRHAAGVAVLAGALVVGVLALGGRDEPGAPLLAQAPGAASGMAHAAQPYLAAHRDFTPAVFSVESIPQAEPAPQP